MNLLLLSDLGVLSRGFGREYPLASILFSPLEAIARVRRCPVVQSGWSDVSPFFLVSLLVTLSLYGRWTRAEVVEG